MSAQADSTDSSDDEAGFTLLELLVAMTLLALLSVALVQAIRFGTRSWHVAETVAENDSKIIETQAQIQLMVERLYPEFVNPTPTSGYILFDGRADRFTFLTPDTSNPGSLSRVTIGEGNLGQDLVLASSKAPELDLDTPPNETHGVLLHGLRSLEISYYGKARPKDAASWHSDWRFKTLPPALIRMRVEFAENRSRTWTELIVAPHTTGDVSCVYDAVMKGCLGR